MFGSIIDAADLSNTFTAEVLITVVVVTELVLWLKVPDALLLEVIWLTLITGAKVELGFLTAVPMTPAGLMMVVPVVHDGVETVVPVAVGGFWTPVPGVGFSLILVVADAVEVGKETLMIGVAVTVACEKRYVT